MTLNDALLFAPVALLIAITPGPNNFCAMNNGIRHGVGTAVLATTGRVVAFAFFLLVSAVGLGAMLLASEHVFTAIKWIGAAYLIYLGINAWRSRAFALSEQHDALPPRRNLWLATRQEFLIVSAIPRPSCCSRRSSRNSSAPISQPPNSFSTWARPTCWPNTWPRCCMRYSACRFAA